MEELIIIQARVNSSRLPRKVLKRIGSKKMLQHVISRCQQTGIETVLVSPESRENDVLECFGIPCLRHGETDVLEMYYQAALEYRPKFICRVTADCPLIDPELIERTLSLAQTADYVTCEGYPRGVWCEAFSFESLSCAAMCATKPYQREHVTPYMRESQWLTGSLKSPRARDYRVCIDEPDDLKTVRNIVDAIGSDCRTPDIIELLDKHPELICNKHVQQREAHVS